MSGALTITPGASTDRPARLADYLCPDSDRSTWSLLGGERWAVRSSTRSTASGRIRTVWVCNPSGGPIDRLDFLLTEDRFVERGADGTLLADLPAVLEPDHTYPLGRAGTVQLTFVGAAVAELAGLSEQLEVIALEADVEGHRRVQWLARGIGELALGPVGGDLDRWLTGWQAGDRRLFGGVV